jgi:hypothetical protein
VKEEATDHETERFFRAVDRAVMDHHSQPSGLPLLLAALPEHHHLFRAVSRNPLLAPVAIDIHPDDLSLDALRERAWRLVEPNYLERLRHLVEAYGTATSKGLGTDDIPQAAKAAMAGRIATLLIEADRQIPGAMNDATGAITLDELADPEVDDCWTIWGSAFSRPEAKWLSSRPGACRHRPESRPPIASDRTHMCHRDENTFETIPAGTSATLSVVEP